MVQTIGMICIGEELLDGRTQEKNAAFVIDWASERAVSVRGIWIVGDEPAPILDALEMASRQCDVVVVSGGLGPTADDLTRDAAALWIGQDLITDLALVTRLEKLFESYGRPFTTNNRRQCAFPEGSKILATEVGTAAGFALEKHGSQIVFFPGVPSEFRWFVGTHLAPLVAAANDGLTHRVRLQFFGLGESQLEDKLAGIEELASSLTARIGYRAAFPIVEVILKTRSDIDARTLTNWVEERVGAWIVGRDHEDLPTRLGALLRAEDATVSVAESCTGGGLGAALTEVSGSSAWFERGYITYANAAKVEELGVSPSVLEQHGAVSPETVCQMALGARERAQSTYALAISGVAGPTGGTPDKPVGTVHFALAGPEGVFHLHHHLGRFDRQRIREASIIAALSLLLWHLEGKLSHHDVQGPYEIEALRQGNLLTP